MESPEPVTTGTSDSDEQLEVVRGQEPYWLKAARIVEDMRGLLDRIEATIETGRFSHPYERVIGWLEEDLGEAEQFEQFEMPSMQNGDEGGEAAA